MSDPWQDAVAYRMPDDPVTKDRVTRAADWLKSHLVSVPSAPRQVPGPGDRLERPDPRTSEPEAPGGLRDHGHPVVSQGSEGDRSSRIAGDGGRDFNTWDGTGTGCRTCCFTPSTRSNTALRIRIMSTASRWDDSPSRTIESWICRVFRQKWDADFSVGHPSLFAEHAVYQALFDFWQGRRDQARHRILEVIKDDRARNPKDRIFWDERDGILVDYVNYDDWLSLSQG